MIALPLALSGVFAYLAVEEVIGVKRESLAAVCAVAYSFNWFTLELFASSLVTFAYASFPLVLLFGSRIFRGRGNSFRNITGLSFAMLFGTILWNIIILPILLIFVLIPLLELLWSKGFANKARILVSGLACVAASVLILLGLTLPYSLGVITSLIVSKGNIAGFASGAGLISTVPSSGSVKELVPTMLSVFLLPFSPTFRSVLWPLGIVFPVLLAIGVLRAPRTRPSSLAFLVPLVLLTALLEAISGGLAIVNEIYTNFFLVDIFSGVTTFLVVLVPLLLFSAFIGLRELDKLLPQRSSLGIVALAFVALLVVVPLASHNFGVVQLGNLGYGGTLGADNYNHPVLLLPASLQNLITDFNLQRQHTNPFRVLWLPFNSDTRQLLTASAGDTFSSSLLENPRLVTQYTSMLEGVGSGNLSLSAGLMSRLGFEYVVVLKGASAQPVSVLRNSLGVPLGLTGSPSQFLDNFNSSNLFDIVSNQPEYTVYQNTLDWNQSAKGVFSVTPVTNSVKSRGEILSTSGTSEFLTDDYTVNVNSSAPSKLTMSVRFDPSWQADVTYSNGTELRVSPTANVWATSFELPGGGVMMVHVVYTKQQTKNILVAASLAVGVVALLITFPVFGVSRLVSGGGKRAWRVVVERTCSPGATARALPGHQPADHEA